MKLIFILGTHRTGSKSIAGFFDETFDQVECVHQYPALRYVNVMSNLKIAGRISEKFYRRFLNKRWIGPILERDDEVYMETNGFNFLAVQYLKQQRPATKVVHAVRDPRTYVVSYLNWIEGRRASQLANAFPFWHVSGPASGHLTRKAWRAMPRFERFCWYWVYKNELIEELYATDAPNYHRYRFEDLTGADTCAETLRSLLDFCELPFEDRMTGFFETPRNRSRGRSMDSWEQWPDEKAQELHALCGGMMARYGYGNEPEWKAKLNS